jgi:hypothetical protein
MKFESAGKSTGGRSRTEDFVKGRFVGGYFSLVDMLVIGGFEQHRWFVEDGFGKEQREDRRGLICVRFHQTIYRSRVRVNLMIGQGGGIQGGGGGSRKGHRHGRLFLQGVCTKSHVAKLIAILNRQTFEK